MSEHYDFVIIGNSAAGLQALITLRRHDRDSSIALVDREDRPAYSRVLTPYYIGGHIPQERLDLVDRSFYAQQGAVTRFGHAVVEVDPERHRVVLADGGTIGYGKLLLATGAEARNLTIRTQRACVLRHMVDAERLFDLYQDITTVTAIGAGLVSLPLLSHAPPNVEKHLVVGSNRIFSRVVDPAASEILEEKLAAQGLSIHKQNDIEEISEADQLKLKLKCGKEIISDLLIIGKGVTPNSQLAADMGLDSADGILIDNQCRTSHPDVFAAGDAAEGSDFISGDRIVQGNWMTAVEQGENAALNMLGLNVPYEGSLKNNITEIFGIDVAAIGYCSDDAPDTAYNWNPATGRFRKVFLDEQQRVIGATMIGETNDSGLYYQLIRTRSPFPGNLWLNRTASYAQVQLRQVA